jgi:hypothetical protein
MMMKRNSLLSLDQRIARVSAVGAEFISARLRAEEEKAGRRQAPFDFAQDKPPLQLRNLSWVVFAVLIILGAFAFSPAARAQGSRKDDIAIGPRGTPLAGASVAICTQPAVTTTAPCSPLATLYSNVTLTQALANPLTTDGLGNYNFYAAPGKYTIQIYGPSVTTKVLPDVILPSDPSSPTFATVTTTSGITAFSLSLSGNLSVAGNSAVTGTLTVAGSPVPSVGQDLQWASNQRFKGPIPERDITAYGPAGGCAQVYWLTNLGLGTISATSNQLAKSTGNWSIPNGCGLVVYGAGATSTLTAPTGLTGSAHTFTGSTNYYYKVIAIDNNLGYGPASSSGNIANGVATLGRDSYNYLYWTAASNAIGYVIYESATSGGTYTAIGTTYTNAYCDMGFWQSANGSIQAPVPDFVPSTPPPSAAGNDALFAQTTAGNGTNTLTLNATASNTATTQLVYPDDSWELSAAVTAINGAYGPDAGAAIVVIPPGIYRFAHSPVIGGSLGIMVEQRGVIDLFQTPIFIGSSNFSAWKGYGSQGGGNGNSGITSGIQVGPNVQAAFVVNSGAWLQGVTFSSQGDGIYVPANATAVNIHDISINSGSGGTNLVGSPLRLDTGIIELWADHLSLTASSLVGGPPAIWFNGETNNAGQPGDAEIYISHISFLNNHSIKVDDPCQCANNGEALEQAAFDNIQTEQNHDHGLLVIDGGATGSEVNTTNLEFSTLDQDSNYSNFNPGILLIGPKGANGPANATGIYGVGAALTSQSIGACFGGACTVNALGVDGGAGIQGFCTAGFSGSGASPGFHVTGSGIASLCTGGSLLDQNLGVMGPNTSGSGALQWAQVVPAPRIGMFVLTPTTGTGSLAAGTYYYRISCINADGGETLATGEISATLSATGRIAIFKNGSILPGCEALRVYVGTTSGGENQWLKSGANNYTMSPPPNNNGVYDDGSSFTRTSGTPASYDTAYESKLGMDTGSFSYLLADNFSGASGTRLGIGTMTDPGTGSNIKVDVAGGTVRGQSGFVAGLSDPAFTNSPRAVYHAFIPALTSASTDATLTLDKGVTVTRVQAQAITAPSGCSTNAIVRVTDGTTPVNVTLSAAANDSGAITQNYASGAALTISVSTAASGCTTSPANVNVEVQYRMQ